MKEGSIASMWRLNLTKIHQMMEEDNNEANFEWEQVHTTGRGPGRISHHTASVTASKDVIVYGGLRGEDSNHEIFQFNPNTNNWLNVTFSVSKSHRMNRERATGKAVTNFDLYRTHRSKYYHVTTT